MQHKSIKEIQCPDSTINTVFINGGKKPAPETPRDFWMDRRTNARKILEGFEPKKAGAAEILMAAETALGARDEKNIFVGIRGVLSTQAGNEPDLVAGALFGIATLWSKIGRISEANEARNEGRRILDAQWI